MTKGYRHYSLAGGIPGGGVTAIKALLAALVSVLALMVLLAPQARAAEAVGPTGPHGFPIWYEDSTGLRLELCLDGPPLCLEGANDPSVPPTPDTFPDEAFWWAGEAAMDLEGGGDALLVLAREAAFLNEVPADGDQMSFSRVRIRATVPVAGATYRVTHPYGADIFRDVSGGPRGINFTEDIGCVAQPCDFAEALNGRVDPFLVWDDLSGLPAGFVGDPLVEHTVVGSPFGTNFFRIEQITDANGNLLASPRIIGETDLFSIQGKVSGLAVFPGPKGGTFDAPQPVTLTASDPAANVFYTLDGSDPATSGTRVRYTGQAINVASTTTLKFIAVDGQGNQSQVFTEKYVIRPPTSIALNAKPSTLVFGKSTALSGTLVSGGTALARKAVILEQRPAGAGSFSRVSSKSTGANGAFSFTGIKPKKNTTYRVRFAGEREGFQPSAGVRQVNVKVRITEKVSARSLRLGGKVVISGAVAPRHAGAVRLTIVRNGALQATKTLPLSNSRYRFVYRPPSAGAYVVRTSFAKHADHLGNSSPARKFMVRR